MPLFFSFTLYKLFALVAHAQARFYTPFSSVHALCILFPHIHYPHPSTFPCLTRPLFSCFMCYTSLSFGYPGFGTLPCPLSLFMRCAHFLLLFLFATVSTPWHDARLFFLTPCHYACGFSLFCALSSCPNYNSSILMCHSDPLRVFKVAPTPLTLPKNSRLTAALTAALTALATNTTASFIELL